MKIIEAAVSIQENTVFKCGLTTAKDERKESLPMPQETVAALPSIAKRVQTGKIFQQVPVHNLFCLFCRVVVRPLSICRHLCSVSKGFLNLFTKAQDTL